MLHNEWIMIVSVMMYLMELDMLICVDCIRRMSVLLFVGYWAVPTSHYDMCVQWLESVIRGVALC